MQAGLGVAPAFRVPDYQLQSVYELPLVLLLGGMCGFVSASFSYSNKVKPLPPPPAWSYPGVEPFDRFSFEFF